MDFKSSFFWMDINGGKFMLYNLWVLKGRIRQIIFVINKALYGLIQAPRFLWKISKFPSESDSLLEVVLIWDRLIQPFLLYKRKKNYSSLKVLLIIVSIVLLLNLFAKILQISWKRKLERAWWQNLYSFMVLNQANKGRHFYQPI